MRRPASPPGAFFVCAPPGGYYEDGKDYNAVCNHDQNGSPVNCDGPDDALPFYWNENPTLGSPQPRYLDPLYKLNPDGDLVVAPLASGDPPSQKQTGRFIDQPTDPCLPGNAPTQASEYMGFLTTLVGVTTPIGAQPPRLFPATTACCNTPDHATSNAPDPLPGFFFLTGNIRSLRWHDNRASDHIGRETSIGRPRDEPVTSETAALRQCLGRLWRQRHQGRPQVRTIRCLVAAMLFAISTLLSPAGASTASTTDQSDLWWNPAESAGECSWYNATP